MKRRSERVKKAPAGTRPSRQEEITAKWTVIAKLKQLHELMPEEIPWPSYNIGRYTLRTGISGRPQAYGIPKDDDDARGYREVELSSNSENNHWNLYLSFSYPISGPGAKWGEITKPDDLSWMQINGYINLWILQIQNEVNCWITKSEAWPVIWTKLGNIRNSGRE